MRVVLANQRLALRIKRRRRIVGAFLVAVAIPVAFVAGSFVPPLVRNAIRPAPTPTPSVESNIAIGGFRASAETSMNSLTDGRVAWTTDWRMCWDAVPGATGYELLLVTGEGVSPRLKSLSTTCYTVGVAAGEDLEDDIPVKRSTQLAIQRGQLAYRVRAVMGPRTVSNWGPHVSSGQLDLPR